jgi:nickel transport protein
MSYARVTIVSPRSEVNFQSGRTDKNGRFCFFPDAAGEWEVMVDDEIGHRLEIDVPIDEQLVWQELSNSAGGGGMPSSRYQKVIMGACFIFGLFGVFAWVKNRKR